MTTKTEDVRVRLHKAAHYGDLAALEQCLREGADVNDYQGIAPLHRAAEQGHCSMVELLLDRGADIDLRDAHGETPLARAARQGHVKVVRLLIRRGASRRGFLPLAARAGWLFAIEQCLKLGVDVNQPDAEGNTALHWAAAAGDEPMARLLLDRGAQTEIKTLVGLTALHWACVPADYTHWQYPSCRPSLGRGDSMPVIKLLLSHGADINAKADSIFTPLLSVLRFGSASSEVVSLLLQSGAKVNIPGPDGCTPLQWAALCGWTDIATLLLKSGADPNAQDLAGRTALLLAAQSAFRVPNFGAPIPRHGSWPSGYHRASQTIKLLLLHNADVNRRDFEGNAAMHYAVMAGRGKLARLLVQSGANLNAVSKTGRTTLMTAARGGCWEMVEYLVASGLQVDARDVEGWTALHYAAEQGHARIVEFLLREKADPGRSPPKITRKRLRHNQVRGDRLGITPLHLAAGQFRLRIVRLLLEAGADVRAQDAKGNTPLLRALDPSNWRWPSPTPAMAHISPIPFAPRRILDSLVNLLLAHGAQVDLRNSSGQSVLELAIEHGVGLTVIKNLLKRGAPLPSAQGGTTPLILAASFARADLIQFFLALGISVDARDEQGQTALHHAARATSNAETTTRLILPLIRAGAKIDVRDNQGATPLHCAAEESATEAVRVLLVHGADRNAQNSRGKTPADLARGETKSALIAT